jgi:flagellar hook-length control protein FliK
MSNVGSMNSFATDTQIAPKVAKGGSSRGGNDHERAGDGFDALLAGLVATVPTPLATSPVVQDEAHQSSQIESQQSAFTDQASSATMPGNERATDANLTLAAFAPIPQNPISNVGAATQGQAVQAQVAGEVSGLNVDTLVANSVPTITSLPTTLPIDRAAVALPTDAAAVFVPKDVAAAALSASTTPPALVPASAAPVAPTTNATLTTTPANAAQPTTSQTDALSQGVPQAKSPQNSDGASTASANDGGDNIGNSATSSDAQPSQVTQAQTAVANDNALLATAAKPKLADVELDTKAATKSVDAAALLTDSGQGTSGLAGQEMATTPTDQAARPPQLTPHTIPMLAATMMRRLESGAKQFTMRLDPPELGQVEVKLTVAADKKVRAVVSADRPEALADLVRSARDLARALREAGLELEENGLSFSLNDPAGNQQQHKNDNSRDQTSRLASNIAAGVNAGDEEAVALDTSHSNAKPNDPFQSWQRARIAITA